MNLQEKINELKSKRVAIVGVPECGKSYLASHLNYPRADKVIYFDRVGVFRQYITTSSAILRITTTPTAQQFFALLKRPEKNIVLDVQLLDDDQIVEFMDALSQFLLYGTQPAANQSTLAPVAQHGLKIALVVDEAPDVLGQSGGGYSKKFAVLCRAGRNYGIEYVVLIFQRLQDMHKRALALCKIYALMQICHPLDLEEARKIIGEPEAEFKEGTQKQLREAKQGEYLLVDVEKSTSEWVHREA